MNELDARKLILKKQYPLILGGSLCAVTFIAVLIVFVSGAEHKYLLTTFGTELLLYMLLNAVSSLIVADLWQHAKRTVLVYVSNLIVIGTLVYLLMDRDMHTISNFYPALGALIFCFFASMVLITLIRMVANFLKQE